MTKKHNLTSYKAEKSEKATIFAKKKAKSNMNIQFKALLATGAMALCANIAAIEISKDNPLLMVVGRDSITRGEFEYMFNKNNKVAIGGPLSVEEYTKLFINYKRKAVDAVAQMYNTRNAGYKAETEAYTKQLMFPYLIDKDTQDEFIKEAYERKQWELSVSHILIAKDKHNPEKEINEAYERVKKGEQFAEVAKAMSSCGSASKGGYLGWFSAFDMIYDFETVAYNTKVGEMSKPFRTKFGWHILLVHDKRQKPIRSKIREIHIASNDEKAQKLADSLETLIAQGKKMEKLAAKYTSSKSMQQKKGEVGWIAKTGVYPMQFVDEVFKLSKGQVGQIISPMGIHIVKVEDIVTAEPMDSAQYAELKANVTRGDREDAVRDRIKENMLARHNYVLNEKMVDRYVALETVPEYDLADSINRLDGMLYTLDGDVISAKEYEDEFKSFRIAYHTVKQYGVAQTKTIVIDTLLSMRENLINDIKSRMITRLTKKEMDKIRREHPEVAYQEKEYDDGLLVYGISKECIWDKWTNRPDSLQAFFLKHKNEYKFSTPKFVGTVAAFKDKKMMEKCKAYVAKNKIPADSISGRIQKEFNLKSEDRSNIYGAWEKGKNKFVDWVVYADTTEKPYQIDHRPYTTYWGEITTQPSNYSQVKGKVLSDFQKRNEEVYNAYLEEKYPVQIIEEVMKTVNKH